MKIPVIILIVFAVIVSLPGCNQIKQSRVEKSEELPRIWMSYSKYKTYDQDFRELRKSGVGAVSLNDASVEAIEAARKHDMQIIMKIEDVTERAFEFPGPQVDRAVMLAGAYQGKAIDRFRFSFAAGPQEIIIENPVYDSINCYGEGIGHYFPNMQDPVKAEVIVKEADFDGSAHLNIIPAQTKRIDQYNWQMKFDLTHVEGDLNNVLLAVYWISEGSKRYWMFGDSASPFATSTREAVANETRKEIQSWADANGGAFPADVITIARYGDECWNLSGHLNCDACSYPIWDYSEAALTDFEKDYPDQIYPRGKSWPDMFGRQAYADWLYNYHQATASLVEVIKATFSEMGLNLPLYRNFTRANVFDVQNDHDGTGLELLTSVFDITLIDPYPVKPDKYDEEVIPIDMNYVAGLSRRFNKKLVPWMQAHQYLPTQGYLKHPNADDIEKIIRQHQVFHPDAAMWLGYGKGEFNTFPEVDALAWKKAVEIQMQLFDHQKKVTSPIAVIRPYNVRALRDEDDRQMQDKVFTNFLSHISTDTLIFYDPFEPLNLSHINIADLQDYPIIVAEAGLLSEDELKTLAQSNKKIVFYIQDADHFATDPQITAIEEFKGKVVKPMEHDYVSLMAIDHYQLNKKARVLFSMKEIPMVWQVENCFFITGIPASRASGFYERWIDLLKK